jgi:hypothetical protein
VQTGTKVSKFLSGQSAFSWQSIFCDLTIILVTVFLSDYIRPFLEKEIFNSGRSIDNYSASLGWMYLAAAFAQTAGMWLMRPMIQSQLIQQGPAEGNFMFIGVIFLFVMHFTIFGFLMVWDGFKYVLGGLKGIRILLPVLFFLFPTATAIFISFPGKKEKALTTGHYWLGWLGTILVTFSVVVISQACWHILLFCFRPGFYFLQFSFDNE